MQVKHYISHRCARLYYRIRKLISRCTRCRWSISQPKILRCGSLNAIGWNYTTKGLVKGAQRNARAQYNAAFLFKSHWSNRLQFVPPERCDTKQRIIFQFIHTGTLFQLNFFPLKHSLPHNKQLCLWSFYDEQTNVLTSCLAKQPASSSHVG